MLRGSLELTNVGDFRPRYYVVAPDVDEIKKRYWESKKITALEGSFDTFMTTLAESMPLVKELAVVTSRPQKHPIESKFRSHSAVSKSALDFLASDVEYVNGILATEDVSPIDFYKGFSQGFGVIEKGLDVRRKLGDTILSDRVLRDVQETSPRPEVALIKAHAGAGKSVLLRRLAWDAAKEYGRICLFANPHGMLSAAAIQELISLCQERIYLFVDDAADRVRELQALLRNIGPEGKLLTIVLAERLNEWNALAQSAANYVTHEYELKYLVPSEIDDLLKLLEENRALGTLQSLDTEARRAAFAERAGRQLLVALHEATSGRPFEDILVNEFQHIEPYEAQRLYLTICVLNRLNVPVRAGVVTRIHGIPFNEFKERFFLPLEHIVFSEFDALTRDFVYRARHSYIADIVFFRILENQEERFDNYVKCLNALNTAYSGDWKAFWEMVRGRTVLDLFSDPSMALTIFSVAKEKVGGDDPHLLHQMGLYEMNRPNGSSTEALKLLTRASEIAPYDYTIKHSIAEAKLRAVDRSRTDLERRKLLKEAAEISVSIISSDKGDSYAHHTLVKICIRKLAEGLQAGLPAVEIEKLVKEAEEVLFDASQKFPGDSYLLDAEAQLATFLKNDKRAMEAMSKAFSANPRNSFIALRLAQGVELAGDNKSAEEILQKALAASPADRRLHYAFAKLMMKSSPTSSDSITYHLRRSFTDGDENYDAQLLYARQLFLAGKFDESRERFIKLGAVRVPPVIRNRLLYAVKGERFEGKVSKVESSYVFITRDGAGDRIYAHVSNASEEVWKNLTFGTRLRFSIAFSMRGANAFDIEIVGLTSAVPAQIGLFSRMS